MYLFSDFCSFAVLRLAMDLIFNDICDYARIVFVFPVKSLQKKICLGIANIIQDFKAVLNNMPTKDLRIK